MPSRHYGFEFWALPKHIAEKKDLTLEDKMVLAVLITRYNGEAPLKMKQDTIAGYIGIHANSVSRSLKKLEDKGYISIKRSWKLNTYKIEGK